LITEAPKEEIAAILALQEIKGFGPVKFRTLFERNHSIAVFFSNSTGESIVSYDPAFSDYPKKLKLVLADYRPQLDHFRAITESLLRKAEDLGAHLITYFDKTYPRNLYKSNSCIPIIYVLGNPEVLANERVCAVVGTRKPSEWAAIETRMAVSRLARDGFVIVSGLARGIDAIAHATAIENAGQTVAVVGSGVDIVYPKENEQLRSEIIERGAIVSEYSFGTPVRSFALKKRNKITVGLAKYVLIAQTSTKGGTMNAYLAAKEQKKSVGVLVPQNRRARSYGGNLKILDERKVRVVGFKSGSEVRFADS
jgi:DNA processing protein